MPPRSRRPTPTSRYRTYEVGKWYTDEHGAGLTVGCPTLIHVDRWAELPQQYKDAVRGGAVRSRTPRSRRPIARPTRRTSRCSRRSCEFLTFSADELAAFRKAGGEPVWEEWVKLRESQGIPGRELLNFLLTQAGVAPKS